MRITVITLASVLIVVTGCQKSASPASPSSSTVTAGGPATPKPQGFDDGYDKLSASMGLSQLQVQTPHYQDAPLRATGNPARLVPAPVESNSGQTYLPARASPPSAACIRVEAEIAGLNQRIPYRQRAMMQSLEGLENEADRSNSNSRRAALQIKASEIRTEGSQEIGRLRQELGSLQSLQEHCKK